MNLQLDSVKIEKLNEIVSLVVPDTSGMSLLSWIQPHKDAINTLLLSSPGVLFRGFSDTSLYKFCEVFSAPLDYIYQSTPRTKLGSGVYTATEYPSDLEILQHCENAYQRTWPLRLYFYCEKAAATGGETPLCDVRKVTAMIPAGIKDIFNKRGVMYVRNYRPGLDLAWETVFQTHDRHKVELFCKQNGIHFEWQGDGHLRTTQVCQGMAKHPITQDELWFNQAHLFHSSNLDKDVRDYLVQVYSERGLPRNAYYGDGQPIDDAILDEIRQIFSSLQLAYKWQDKDLLIIDNMLCSHGRKPFSGARKVLVAMGNATSGFSDFRALPPDQSMTGC